MLDQLRVQFIAIRRPMWQWWKRFASWWLALWLVIFTAFVIFKLATTDFTYTVNLGSTAEKLSQVWRWGLGVWELSAISSFTQLTLVIIAVYLWLAAVVVADGLITRLYKTIPQSVEIANVQARYILLLLHGIPSLLLLFILNSARNLLIEDGWDCYAIHGTNWGYPFYYPSVFSIMITIVVFVAAITLVRFNRWLLWLWIFVQFLVPIFQLWWTDVEALRYNLAGNYQVMSGSSYITYHSSCYWEIGGLIVLLTIWSLSRNIKWLAILSVAFCICSALLVTFPDGYYSWKETVQPAGELLVPVLQHPNNECSLYPAVLDYLRGPSHFLQNAIIEHPYRGGSLQFCGEWLNRFDLLEPIRWKLYVPAHSNWIPPLFNYIWPITLGWMMYAWFIPLCLWRRARTENI